MKIMCQWCLEEGEPGFIGEAEPNDDPTVSHGLCPEHWLQVQADLSRNFGEAVRLRRELEELRRKVDP